MSLLTSIIHRSIPLPFDCSYSSAIKSLDDAKESFERVVGAVDDGTDRVLLTIAKLMDEAIDEVPGARELEETVIEVLSTAEELETVELFAKMRIQGLVL